MGLFGPEKITLTLERYDFKPGDVIKGMVSLNLKKPTRARKLVVSLLGTRKVRQRTSKGYRVVHEIVYDFDLMLDGEKEYQGEQYPFEIKIPSDLFRSETQKERTPGQFEEKLEAVRVFLGTPIMGQEPLEWSVRAQLDVPMGLDVQKSQDIVISSV